MRRHAGLALCFVLSVSSLTGCRHAASDGSRLAAAGAATTPLDVEGEEARTLYAQGQKQLRRGTFGDALKTFGEVKSLYPYSSYAALAELAEADTYFRELRFIEAADAYRTFLRYHPAHPEVRYALGQVAESQYAQLPHAWWFMPPVAEKDPSILHAAIEAYDDFLSRFGASAGAARARQNRDACRQKLADHELYVARFYYKRKQWAGAYRRALNLLATYPKLETEPETLWLAGSAAHHMGDAQAASDSLTKLVTTYPHAAEAKRARVLQARLLRQVPES